MTDSPGIATRLGSTVAATLILIPPALWNRFPLLEYDTGGYLARWFEGYLVPSRSTTYGLFLAAGWPLDFWPIVILQAAATVWIIGLLLRTHRFPVYPIALPAITAGLALTTALPWLASALMTDIFAGLAVLALHALVWYGDRVSRCERYALIVFIAFAGSTHSATFAVLLGLGAAALLLSWLNARLVPRAGLAAMLIAVVLSAACCSARTILSARPSHGRPAATASRSAACCRTALSPVISTTIVQMRSQAVPVPQRIATRRRHVPVGQERIQRSRAFCRARR